ncbi:MAG: glycerophosphodiester phosphodiesterase family protein, partial [Candidatus Doudnabacteria bacterium]|nr:glycerophosphodiester phosphodiesterase family protein [Candidatus Doudnabacteria bacterium]
MEIVGHRGASGYAPENTLLSFSKAMEIGCDWVEMDIRLSKDGHAIVIHDATVDRTTNGRGLVADMTLEEIKKFNCAEKQKISSLEEVIILCQNKIKFLIELKAPGTPKVVSKIISDYKIIQDVLIISFDLKLLKEIKILNPQIKVGYLFKN